MKISKEFFGNGGPWHIANIISLFRIVGTPVWLFAALYLKLDVLVIGGIYLFLGLTDMIDGTIARIKKLKSDYGRALDAMGDITYLVLGGVYVAVKGLVSHTAQAIALGGICFIIILNVLRFTYFKKKNFGRSFAGCVTMWIVGTFLILAVFGIVWEWYMTIAIFMIYYHGFEDIVRLSSKKFKGWLF